MPIPIRPAGNQADVLYEGTDKGTNSFFMMNLDSLAGAAASGSFLRSGSIKINAEATDADAMLLLELFNKCTIVSEAESVEDKKYAIPDNFSSDTILRLKAASLLHGDTKIIGFTSKAARVIKTMVLSEQNAYMKSAVVKPYSVIMAENKRNAAGHDTLAFSKTASNTSEILVFAQKNQAIPEEYMPTRSSRLVTSRSLVKTEYTDTRSTNKQYHIGVFEVNGKFPVIAFNGRNVNQAHLTCQPKGVCHSLYCAMNLFNMLENLKISEGYENVDGHFPTHLLSSVDNVSLNNSNPNPNNKQVPVAEQKNENVDSKEELDDFSDLFKIDEEFKIEG